MRVDRREFQFIDGSSNKFWAIELDGKAFTVHFGRIGTTGQAKEKAFGVEDVARREYDKLILEKTRNGYIEVAAGTSSSGAPPAPRTTPPAVTSPIAATTDLDGKEAPARPAVNSSPARPAPAPRSSASAGPLERRVRLTEADWAQVSWRRVKPARPAQPRPFDFEASLNQVKAAGLSGWGTQGNMRQGHSRPAFKRGGVVLARRPLDITSYDPATLEERLRQTHARGLPDGAQVRAWARDIAARSEIIYRLAPQTLRPFFTPVELAELLLAVADAARARARWGSEEDGLRAMRNFSALIVPQMSEDERSGFRNAMEQMYDAEPRSLQGELHRRFALDRRRWRAARRLGGEAGRPRVGSLRGRVRAICGASRPPRRPGRRSQLRARVRRLLGGLRAPLTCGCGLRPPVAPARPRPRRCPGSDRPGRSSRDRAPPGAGGGTGSRTAHARGPARIRRRRRSPPNGWRRTRCLRSSASSRQPWARASWRKPHASTCTRCGAMGSHQFSARPHLT